MAMKKFEGNAQCQFNLYITVRAKNKKDAEREILEFLDCVSEDFDTVRELEGVRVHQVYDECFEVMDVTEKK